MKILVVSRDTAQLGCLAEPLSEVGHRVEAVPSTSLADEALRTGHFDGIVVDLPDRAGAADEIAWLRSLRERRVRAGIATLSALCAVDARIAAVEAGADDHLVRPCDPRELVSRCQALLHRQLGGAARADVTVCGELVVDGRRREVRHGSMPIDLTPREWAIFEFLVAQAGSTVPKDRLLRELSGWEERLAPNAIEVYVSRLRAKLAGTGARISTVRGVGYRLEMQEQVD